VKGAGFSQLNARDGSESVRGGEKENLLKMDKRKKKKNAKGCGTQTSRGEKKALTRQKRGRDRRGGNHFALRSTGESALPGGREKKEEESLLTVKSWGGKRG